MQALFSHIRQYCDFSQEAIESLGSVLKPVKLEKGEFLTTEGKVCNSVYFVEQGCLRGYYNLDGKEITYWFAFENNFVTSLLSFVTRNPGMENIQLLEDCKLWEISYDDLHRLYKKHTDVNTLGRIINERYYVMLEERFVSNHFKEARDRYENLLATAPHILQRVPLGHVASYLGMTQETLSRIRSKS